MGFFKKLKKRLTKAAALYGKVGGLVGAPGAGIASRAASVIAAREMKRARRPGESVDSHGHNRRAMFRSQGIGHNRMKLMMMQRRGAMSSIRTRPRRGARRLRMAI